MTFSDWAVCLTRITGKTAHSAESAHVFHMPSVQCYVMRETDSMLNGAAWISADKAFDLYKKKSVVDATNEARTSAHYC